MNLKLKSNFTFTLLYITLSLSSCIPSQSKIKTAKDLKLKAILGCQELQKPWISVHRGGGLEKKYPENCITSFRHYAKKFPSIIECDLRLSLDSVLVLLHDDKLERASTGEGLVSEKKYKDVKKYRLEDHTGHKTRHKVPSLDRALRFGKNKVIYTLDVKKGVPYALVIQYKAHPYAAVITYNTQQAAEVYQLDPRILISVSIQKTEDYENLKSLEIPDQNMLAFIGTHEPSKGLIDFLHQKNIAVILGTLGKLGKKACEDQGKSYAQWMKLG